MTNSNDQQNPYTAPKSEVNPSISEGMTKCKGCSNDMHQLASTCPHCGLSQRSRPYKNKNIAGVLAMLFGAFGVHRFFLGQWWGLFYLLTFWTGIPSIVSFVEAIVFWCSNVTSWDIKYNEGRPANPSEQTGAGVVVLIVIVVGFVGVAMIGILAAIAIPAYQDYTIRARVMQSIVETSEHKIAIQEYYNSNDQLPSSLSEIGIESDTLPSGNTAELSDTGFTITYVGQEAGLAEGKTIEFQAFLDEGRFAWDCTGGSVLNQHRPSKCRDGGAASSYEE